MVSSADKRARAIVDGQERLMKEEGPSGKQMRAGGIISDRQALYGDDGCRGFRPTGECADDQQGSGRHSRRRDDGFGGPQQG